MEKNTTRPCRDIDFSNAKRSALIKQKSHPEVQKLRSFRRGHQKEIVSGSYFKTFITVLPVVSAGMYLLGTMYYQGYLKAFGIDDSLFPLTIDKTLFSGFVVFVSFGLVPILYAIVAFLVLLFATLIVIVLCSADRVKKLQLRVMDKICRLKYFGPNEKIETSARMKRFIDLGGDIYSYTVGVFLLGVSLLVIALLSEKSGREQGIKEMAKFHDPKDNLATLYTSKLPGPVRAKQIMCGASHCAFFLGKESIILRHENVDSVVTHPPSKAQ